ncbi:MAG: hypothetical protein R2941_01235 [Desulfobacterales bacterium]
MLSFLPVWKGKCHTNPKISMEVWDIKPDDWAEAAVKPFEDVISDQRHGQRNAWKNTEPDMITLQLISIDPNDKNASPAEAVATVKKVMSAVDVPLAVWGTGSPQKDEEVLKKVAGDCPETNLVLGPVEDKNLKVSARHDEFPGHSVISSSPHRCQPCQTVNIGFWKAWACLDNVIVDPHHRRSGIRNGIQLLCHGTAQNGRHEPRAMTNSNLPLYNNLVSRSGAKETKLKATNAPTLGDPRRAAF